VVEKTGIDEKAKAAAGAVKGKADEFLEKTDLDEKLKAKAGEVKDKVKSAVGKEEEKPAEEAAPFAEKMKAEVEDIKE